MVLDYQGRLLSVMKRPAALASDAWLFGELVPTWSNQRDRIGGYDARKVSLKTEGTRAEAARDAGECWIAESLMLVMRERFLRPDGSVQLWEITDVHQGPPELDVLAIPPGFRQSNP